MESHDTKIPQVASLSNSALRASAPDFRPTTVTATTIGEAAEDTPQEERSRPMNNFPTTRRPYALSSSHLGPTPEKVSNFEGKDFDEPTMRGRGIKAVRMCSGTFDTLREKRSFEKRTAFDVQCSPHGTEFQRENEELHAIRQQIQLEESESKHSTQQLAFAVIRRSQMLEMELAAAKGENVNLRKRLEIAEKKIRDMGLNAERKRKDVGSFFKSRASTNMEEANKAFVERILGRLEESSDQDAAEAATLETNQPETSEPSRPFHFAEIMPAYEDDVGRMATQDPRSSKLL
ncbi:uncharacterized protein RSE6_12307 [Rhynchosporium secalis]|uniref:Uncharacterized protein n=1 Tax=Rhynchosporium secalis TaxID=38038 RepID=A0A1E1MQ54_RHYSE|nr:uncharacterized protein RSE6_12307 [Rhynchosporium secalis]